MVAAQVAVVWLGSTTGIILVVLELANLVATVPQQ
jgi:hypothetical protein